MYQVLESYFGNSPVITIYFPFHFLCLLVIQDGFFLLIMVYLGSSSTVLSIVEMLAKGPSILDSCSYLQMEKKEKEKVIRMKNPMPVNY